ncbi:MAG: ATP-grasp domain-containing protein, partial [Spirochaetales bacterium]
KELAVMVARDREGKVLSYPVVEMVFNPDHNICDSVLAPARINEEVAATARSIAEKAVQALQGVGVFGVELFLYRDKEILLNEVAPRPHNSGHYTIEACLTSQFEQHLRAICGLPLGEVTQKYPAFMLNLLGEANAQGKPYVEGFREALALPGVSIHLYGKQKVRPYRKMGHVTIVGSDLAEVLEKAEKIRAILKVRSI